MIERVPRSILPLLLISFAAACSGDAGDTGTGPLPRADSTSAVIPAGGGTLRIDGVASVGFPAGAVPAGTLATLQKTASAEYAGDFAITAGSVYEGAVQAPYQVVIDVAGERPVAEVPVTVTVPASVQALAPSGSELRVFYTLFQISDDEREQTVELLPGRFARTAGSATVGLPPEAFAGEETGFRSYRAVVYIGYTLTGATAASTVRSPVHAAGDESGGCGPVPLAYPLDRRAPVKSGFGLRRHPRTGLLSGHAGMDLGVPSGTPVRAMADGKVTVVGYQYNAALTTGWGYFVVIQHGPGFSLYAHLTEAGRIAQGTVVRAGDVIARSGASGGVTGPHLHIEYGPNGQYTDKNAKVDPGKCFGPTLFTDRSEFQAATQGTATLTFDGIPNGVPSSTPGGYPGVAYYSRASFGPVTLVAAHANSNKPGFTTVSNWAVHQATHEFYRSGAHFGDALIPSLGAHGNDDGIIFELAESITAVGAHFGSVQEVSPCCVRQWVLVTFRDGGSLGVDLNDLRGGERPSDSFFGIASPGRPIASIEFNQLGHNPLLDNFTYGQAQ